MLGCSEMLVIGMLDLIAADVRVSISAAGALPTAQALGMALGGPLLTAWTITWNKLIVLIGALGLTVVANLVLVLTGAYGLYLAARAVAGAAQGLFIAAGIAVAVSLVPAERTGRAMSVVISGFAVSSAVGVPLGTLGRPRAGVARVVRRRDHAGRDRPGGDSCRRSLRPWHRRRRLAAGTARVHPALILGAGGIEVSLAALHLFGGFAAISASTAAAAALTGFAIAILAIGAAVATSFLKPSVTQAR